MLVLCSTRELKAPEPDGRVETGASGEMRRPARGAVITLMPSPVSTDPILLQRWDEPALQSTATGNPCICLKPSDCFISLEK